MLVNVRGLSPTMASRGLSRRSRTPYSSSATKSSDLPESTDRLNVVSFVRRSTTAGSTRIMIELPKIRACGGEAVARLATFSERDVATRTG